MEEIKVHKLDSYPIVKHYLDDLGVNDLLSKYLPTGTTLHIECLCVLVLNIIISVRPLYKISDWLGSYADGQSEFGYDSRSFTDDRLAESLDLLYQSDRNSLMSSLSIEAIKKHNLATNQIHNDTTTISLSGDYAGLNQQDSDSVKPLKGHNKDGRPQAKQIVFGLNVTSDGYVPLSSVIYDGNISDDKTHKPNWNALKDLLQKTDFIYIADSKLGSKENLAHIANNKGKFITILSGSRSEVKTFKAHLLAGKDLPKWEQIAEYPHSRKKDKKIIYETCPVASTKEGYQLHWIRSSAKTELDAQQREKHIQKIEKELSVIQGKLNTYYLKTNQQIQAKVDKILGDNRDFFDVNIKESTQIKKVKIGKGRIGKNTLFEDKTITCYELQWSQNTEKIEAQSRIDGIFPLVTNTNLDAQQTLEKYKEQPYLEKRFSTFKSITKIAPIWLKKVRRIEAMLFLYFIALMVIALMERAMRNNMEEEKIEKIPILPQKMNTQKPTWNNIRYFFEQVFFVTLNKGQTIIVKGLTKLHYKVLELLNLPKEIYDIMTLNWWRFSSV